MSDSQSPASDSTPNQASKRRSRPQKARTKATLQLTLAEVFRQNGYDGTSLDNLSTATGLSRSSLYHHFPQGKQEMGHSALAQVMQLFDQQVLQPLARPTEPLSRLQQMVATLDSYYEQGQLSCVLIAFSIGESRQQFRADLRQIADQWVTAIATVLQQAGFASALATERAEEAIIQIEGALVLAMATDQRDLFQRTLSKLPSRLLTPTREAD
jgi:TetR/AcrR family transcriptional regulator, lmrAB and yxaGH operons repressor